MLGPPRQRTLCNDPYNDYLGLVDLYNAAGGTGWTRADNWLLADAVCTWFGVTCVDGHVTYV